MPAAQFRIRCRRAGRLPALPLVGDVIFNQEVAEPSGAILSLQPHLRHLPVVAESVVTLVDRQAGQTDDSRKSCSWLMVLVPMNG